MTTIRFIAVLSESPDRLAAFYKRFLEMVEIGRSAQGDISLSDGFYNFTLLKRRPALGEPRMDIGLHHVGLEVESIEEIRTRYRRFNPRGVVMAEPGDVHHGAIRIYDPECNPVSLYEKSFGINGDRRLPRLAHVAFNALDPEIILSFYTQVLGLRELEGSYLRRQQGRLNRFAGDGHTNLAIHPFYSAREGHEPRFGINHVGFLVRDLKRTIDDLSTVVSVQTRPADRPYAEFRLRDPEGNALDLSQTKGWEVDVGKWESAA